ncbi:glycosyltransferase family 4 protein [Sporosarcina sp. OR05]|uniref:glycosyltransferase family 4 protein n=1 Tax=Sporosarcina sp. OR05 TaxID=2969819 RepID=UPI00352A7BF1
MRILHCCLSCFYIDEYNYQENVLPKIHHQNGHEVKIIASTEVINNNKSLSYVLPSSYKTPEGINITRVPYRRYLPHVIMKKIRHYKYVKKLIEDFKPDVILFHGVPAFELFTVSRYKKNNPNIRLYVDSHEDENNSARNLVSKYILHSFFYKFIVQKNIQSIDSVLYITPESKDFLKKYYNIPEDKLEFFPLGGVIIEEKQKKEMRLKVRNELNLKNEDILLCHSGKMNKNKKTKELVENFIKIKNENLKLIIIGTFTQDVEKVVMPLIQSDSRINYLGWKSAEELMEYLAASDLYVQPGSQSATMQNALCVGTPVLFKNVKSHEIYMKGNAFSIDNYNEMEIIFNNISNDNDLLKTMSKKAYCLARDILDYNKLAKKITE